MAEKNERRPLTDQVREAAAGQVGETGTASVAPAGGGAELPVARAIVLPPTGRRTMAAAVVLRCPYCSRSHLHRGFLLDAAVRWSGCNPNREYLLKAAAR